MYFADETRNQAKLTGFIDHRRQVLRIWDVPILPPAVLKLSRCFSTPRGNCCDGTSKYATTTSSHIFLSYICHSDTIPTQHCACAVTQLQVRTFKKQIKKETVVVLQWEYLNNFTAKTYFALRKLGQTLQLQLRTDPWNIQQYSLFIKFVPGRELVEEWPTCQQLVFK